MRTKPRDASTFWTAVTWVSRALAVALMLYLVVPRVQAMTRPKRPPNEEMQLASIHMPAFDAAPTPPVPAEYPRNDRERLLVAAYSLLGIPYEWGAKGPDTYDCSGFTKEAYAAVGVRLPDGSFNQADGEQPLTSIDDLMPGDLLFYRWYGDVGVTHVTIYAGEGWAIGTGSPGQPAEVVVYPLAGDFRVPDTVVTYRHIELPDER